MLGPVREPSTNCAQPRFGLRALVWAVLLAVLAVVLAFIPLFDVLGYDFCFALGLAAALAASTSGRAWSPSGAGRDARGAAAPVRGACGVAAALLVLPLLISVANALRVRNCSFAAGSASSRCCRSRRCVVRGARGRAGRRGGPPRAGAWSRSRSRCCRCSGRWFASIAIRPCSRSTRSAATSRADLRRGAAAALTLVCFRLVNLVWIATAVAIGDGGGRARLEPAPLARRPLAAAVPLVAASIVLYAMGGSFQFRITRARSRRVLDRTLTTDHFVVHYAPARSRAPTVALTPRIWSSAISSCATLGVAAQLSDHRWEFPSADVKKALVGAGGTLYARPWTREIFIQTTASRRARCSTRWRTCSRGRSATAGSGCRWRGAGTARSAADAVGRVDRGRRRGGERGRRSRRRRDHPRGGARDDRGGLAPPLAAVVGAGFSTLAGRRAYTIAGSFSAFLLATRGAGKLRALYRSAGNFADVYRVPLADSRPSGASSWRSSR
jgi:hypothetical protein